MLQKFFNSDSLYEGKILKVKILVKLSGVAFLFSATSAQAYVDPGSGSVIITTILGTIAAVGYIFRKYFYKIKRKFSGNKDHDDTGKDHDDTGKDS